MEKEEYIEIILQLKDWYEQKINSLQMIIDKGDESKITFEDSETNDSADLPEKHKKGFLIGIGVAIEQLGKFPVNIEEK